MLLEIVDVLEENSLQYLLKINKGVHHHWVLGISQICSGNSIKISTKLKVLVYSL